MNTDFIFRIALASLLIAYTIIRLSYARLAMESGKKFFRPHNDVRQIAFGMLFFRLSY